MRNTCLCNLEYGLPNEIGEGSYYFVVGSPVPEHIAYPDKLLKDIKRVLKKNGTLIVALTNLFHYKSWFRLLKSNFHKEDAGIWDFTHLRWYSFISAKELLTKYFILERVTISGKFPFNSLA